MKIYIDEEFMCHTSPKEGRREVETAFFDGKCREFIEGYRFVPAEEVWMREDGEFFEGEMVTPFKDTEMLNAFQAQYEKLLAQQQDMRSALDAIYGGVTDE